MRTVGLLVMPSTPCLTTVPPEELPEACGVSPQIYGLPTRTFCDFVYDIEATKAFSVVSSPHEIRFRHQAFSLSDGLFPKIVLKSVNTAIMSCCLGFAANVGVAQKSSGRASSRRHFRISKHKYTRIGEVVYGTIKL
jgi:hypothetical protein